MVTTGAPTSSATKTEILDLVSGKICTDLADFPVENYGGVGANLNGTPIVCGGYSSDTLTWLKTCYTFTDSAWQTFTSMKEKRYQAAGVMYNNSFHVFGGSDGSSPLLTTELISIDGGVEYGPDLPTAVRLHAITFFNSTMSILSGGYTSAANWSPLTWFFNHETQAFSPGPSLLEARRGHGSATCVDKVTQEKIPVVSGGYDGGAMNSTEMLINGTEWKSGTIQ